MEPVVHFRAAVSLLGRFPALAGVDLEVQRGSIVLVHGPNGAGKTTLLRTCAGLVPVVAGDAVVLGHDLRDAAARRAVRRRVGLLGHATALILAASGGRGSCWSNSAPSRGKAICAASNGITSTGSATRSSLP